MYIYFGFTIQSTTEVKISETLLENMFCFGNSILQNIQSLQPTSMNELETPIKADRKR